MPTDPTQRLRRMLVAVLAVGMLGVGAELALTGHDEDLDQRIPLFTIAAGLAALAWHAFAGSRASCAGLRLAMLLLAGSGALGLYLHQRSNAEFQAELNPGLDGWGLLLATLRATSPPSLAPGVLALLGAIGWIATHRDGRTGTHPRKTTQ